MNKNFGAIILFILFFGYQNLSAQTVKGSGNLKTEVVEFNGFKNLILNGNFSVTLVQGDLEGIRINTDDNLVNLFQTRMDNETLFITMSADIRKFEELNVFISYRELKQITLLNNVKLNSTQVVHFDDLDIFISGACTINAEFFASSITVNQYDQSFSQVTGFAEKLIVNVHDETELNFSNLKSETCEIVSTGYSEVMVNCSKTLKLKVTGASNVYYSGEPAITERIFSSNGFIVKRKAE